MSRVLPNFIKTAQESRSSPHVVISVAIFAAERETVAREAILGLHPADSAKVLKADVGGLMALFLGASLVTFLEVADLVARSGCRACTRSLQTRKHTRRKSSSAGATAATSTTSAGGADTNHVLFRSVVDVNDDEMETTTSADGVVSANHRNHHVNRGLQSTSTRASSLHRTPTSPSSTSSATCVPLGHQGGGGSGTAGSSPATAASVGGGTGLVGLSTTLSRTINDNGGHVRPTASNALVAALLSETDI